MSDPLCSEGQRRLHTVRTSRLPGMERHRNTVLTGLREYRGEILSREQAFRACDVHRADHIPKIFLRSFYCLHVQLLIVRSTHTAENQTHTNLWIHLHAAFCSADGCLDNLILSQSVFDGKLRRKSKLRILHALLRKILHQFKGHTLDGIRLL